MTLLSPALSSAGASQRLPGAERHAWMRHARSALNVSDSSAASGNHRQDHDDPEKHPHGMHESKRCAWTAHSPM